MKGMKKVVLGLGMIIMSLLTTQTQHISDVIVSHVAHGSYQYGGLYYILSFLFIPGIILTIWGMVEKD